MHYKIYILSLMFFLALVSCRGYVEPMGTNDATPVIRTDFTDETAWKKVKRDITKRNILGFSANVRFIDEVEYSGLTGQELLQLHPDLKDYGCVFVADQNAMSSAEHHLLVLDPSNPKGRTFRVILSEAWAVENNLAISNMDYSEFADAVDSDGVFRGFK